MFSRLCQRNKEFDAYSTLLPEKTSE